MNPRIGRAGNLSWLTSGSLIALTAALLFVTGSRLELTYDLGFFLPPPTNSAERVLIERLGEGPGTQLIFAVLTGSDAETARITAESLRAVPNIARVLPEINSPTIAEIPKSVWKNRLLLGDLPMTKASWLAVLEERAMDAMLADDELLDLIAADPAFNSIRAMEGVAATDSPSFASEDSHYLLIQTKGGAFDIDAQQAAVAGIRAALHDAGQHSARLYGSGVYGVDLQASIQRESILFSTLASIGLALVVFWRFRSLKTVLLVGVPLVIGGATGLATLALVFGQVHGITVAFGFTLLGVAIDYPLHLFSHQHAEPQRIWPTLALGIASTLTAYLAFALSGTKGMQQLGVFAASGIAAAAACTYLITQPANQEPIKRTHPIHETPEKRVPLRQWLWLTCLLVSSSLCIGLLNLTQASLFSDNLSEMTPVPKSTLKEDAKLRASMGVADLRYLVSVRGQQSDEVLRNLEHTGAALDALVSKNVIESYQSIASLIPSEATQLQRRKRAAELLASGAFTEAVSESEFDPDAFSPFFAALERTATTPTVAHNADRLKTESPELASLIDSLLYKSADRSTVGLVFLQGFNDKSSVAISDALQGIPDAELIDLKNASTTLVQNYRQRILSLLGTALIVIAGLLLLATRSPTRVLWLVGTVTAALAASTTVGAAVLGGLSLFDVVALALVAGLGLDYALFFSKEEACAASAKRTQRAINLCALSSLMVFGILSLSSIPLLHGLGVTVGSGVATAYLLARWGLQKPAMR